MTPYFQWVHIRFMLHVLSLMQTAGMIKTEEQHEDHAGLTETLESLLGQFAIHPVTPPPTKPM